MNLANDSLRYITTRLKRTVLLFMCRHSLTVQILLLTYLESIKQGDQAFRYISVDYTHFQFDLD